MRSVRSVEFQEFDGLYETEIILACLLQTNKSIIREVRHEVCNER